MKRVNLISAVNASNIRKDGASYYIKDLVHAVDGIVLNGRLYPGDELQKSVATLEGKPAPAGHPKDDQGRHISASNGKALASAYIGAHCTNSRYEGGRAMCDVVINEAQAKALPAGAEIIARLDAAILGTNTEPISVSSGLLLREIAANGESRGKKYRAIATDMNFDHVAFLLNEKPAGSPADGIGVFVNEAGEESEVETVKVNEIPTDEDTPKFIRWLTAIFANVKAQKSTSLSSSTDEVDIEPVEIKPATNGDDPVKEIIIEALNSAGVAVAGLDDAQLLAAYNSLQAKPIEAKLADVTAKLATLEANAAAAADAEVTALAAELAANSSLTVDDLKKLGADRLKEIKANTKAAPILPAQGGTTVEKLQAYSLNAEIK